MSFPFVSVVIPAYNAAATIAATVESVIEQSLTNIEVLIVDDGSTDNTLEIVCQLALQDKRIRVFHQVNSGVSAARNKGIDNAVGEWITFVDSDDLVNREYVEDLYMAVTSDFTEFAVSGYLLSSGKGGFSCVCLEEKSYAGNDEYREFIAEYYNNPVIKVSWSKLYKRTILNDKSIRYNRYMRLSEDALFVLDYLRNISSASVVGRASYIYKMPLSLDFKYNLSLDEAIYKAESIDSSLIALGQRCNIDVMQRVESNWKSALAFVDFEILINSDVYASYKIQFNKHCGKTDLRGSLRCNLYWKCISYMLVNKGVDGRRMRSAVDYVLANSYKADHIHSKEIPLRARFVDCIAKFKSRMLIKCVLRI